MSKESNNDAGASDESVPSTEAALGDLMMAQDRVLGDLPGLKGPKVVLGQEHDGCEGEALGTEIGAYRLVERIGVGGMGEVYLADQKVPVQRQVALKIIKLGMDSKEIVARFETERQALALMDHPNIAHVYDGGTTELGRPYFVMELVRGMPITQYCNENQLGIPERLKIFVKVCQAVQHAHQKGIIHRDLKPSNVLVTTHDDVPVPKVIDFGIAKALDQKLTDMTLQTRAEQVLGTPAYMSPEQIAMGGEDIDTRTDVYGLGVLLYELLTGRQPFDQRRFSEASYGEVCRIICHEDPPRPSTCVTALPNIDASAIRQSQDTKKLVGRLRGDLDWIVMKALEKDRTRRYESASGLADDVERYLGDQPVSAAAPSTWYQLCKLARRRKGAFIAAALVAATLAIGAVLTSWQAFRAVRAEVAATQRLSETMLGNGVRVAEEGETLQALLWLAKVVEVAADNGRDDRIAQLRFQSHLRYSPRLLHVLTHPTKGIDHTFFSPDGALIVTGGLAGDAILWDTATGLAAVPPLKHPGPVLQSSFSHDGRLLATACSDGSGRMWSVDDGTPTCDPLMHDDNLFWAEFTADDQMLLTAGHRGNIYGWSAPDGEKRFVTNNLPDECARVRAHPDPQRKIFASSCMDGTARIHDLQTGAVLHELSFPRGDNFYVEFSPNGHYLIGTSSSAEARVWDVETGELVGTPLTHQLRVQHATFDPSSRFAVTTSMDGMARVWDFMTGTPLTYPLVHDAMVPVAAISPDSRYVVTGDASGASLWHWRSETRRSPHLVFGNLVLYTHFDPHGETILGHAQYGAAKVWSVSGGMPMAFPNRHTRKIRAIALNGRGTLIASASDDQTVILWDSKSRQPIHSLSHPGEVIKLQFQSNGRHLLTVCLDGGARVWDVATGELVGAPLMHEAELLDACYNADGTRIATGGADRKAKIWNMKGAGSNEPVLVLNHQGQVASVAFSPNGRLVLTCQYSQDPEVHTDLRGVAQVWDALSGEAVGDPLPYDPAAGTNAHFTGDDDWVIVPTRKPYRALVINAGSGDQLAGDAAHQAAILHLALNHDRSRLVTASEDNSARVWDTTTGAHIGRPLTHQHDVCDAAFSHDGTLVVTASRDKTARVWEVATGLPITPPLRHTHWVEKAAFHPDGSRVYTLSGSRLYEWSLEVERMGGDDCRGIAELVNDARLDSAGYIEQGMQGDLRSTHSRLSQRFPQFFTFTAPERAVWHAMEATFSKEEGDGNAATLHRERAIQLGAPDVGAAEGSAPDQIPARDPACTAAMLDLSSFFNNPLTVALQTASSKDNHLGALPRGRQVFGAVPFDVRGMVCIESAVEDGQSAYPDRVDGIPVNQVCQRMHFLHSGKAREGEGGADVGYYRIHYADGETLDIALKVGQSFRELWHLCGLTKERAFYRSATDALEIWIGENPEAQEVGAAIHLYKMTWQNPHPEKEIDHLDFAVGTHAAKAFVVAITAE